MKGAPWWAPWALFVLFLMMPGLFIWGVQRLADAIEMVSTELAPSTTIEGAP